MPEQVITSFLDTDMYKLTMHAAVFLNFPDAKVTYKYTNRSSQLSFNEAAIEWLKNQLNLLSNIRFTTDEIAYLKREIPYLPKEYIDFISNSDFKLKPDEHITFNTESFAQNGETRYNIDLLISGLWTDTILYEIPLLALVSEAYFKFVDTDWDYENQVEKAKQKALDLMENGLKFSEFGTRRRRSYHTQQLVLQGIMDAVATNEDKYKDILLGTSNVLFAKNFNIKPIGTVAHEWIMGIAALTDDYINANKNSMKYWVDTFGSENAGLALTDTFGTDDFLKSFLPPYSDYYIGVRQDSGDPAKYTEKIAHHYHEVLKLPKFSKVLCYSDSLNVEKAITYGKVAKENGMIATFGIGTNFTNDFQLKSDNNIKSEPLNIVIKLLNVNGNHAIKISDNLGKNMGDPSIVKRVKEELGYVERKWSGDNEAHRWSA
ncbi:similar to Saccharomyces cerevisiae YOR209C NPT1 Nicotinate phosphoribosyltransferase, acts in the salvage pathway of NAD+ biosynthesis [Maudiozyma saulgeensis]|uniref:Nicotinate phosphoribosyltransferase n=1 Tax=Maudiozyma saulgeensis TaxID=1789683 RepID=A0A1X7R963_9SACH|nr:similar to Saccharomyces cerevisiae YOR209C NPT1 Nicotinate phosphoribosyltransferase, acts in the salvage pathway of NAD+ biosynthesis [Kazachstania saulgeensis]